jgi:hypothetical protein
VRTGRPSRVFAHRRGFQLPLPASNVLPERRVQGYRRREASIMPIPIKRRMRLVFSLFLDVDNYCWSPLSSESISLPPASGSVCDPSLPFAPPLPASLAFKRDSSGRSPAHMRGIGVDNNATVNAILLMMSGRLCLYRVTHQQTAAHPFWVLA